MISKNSGGACKILLLLFAISCHYPSSRKQQLNNEQALQHSPYDDSTLNNNLLPVLMPFNRISVLQEQLFHGAARTSSITAST